MGQVTINSPFYPGRSRIAIADLRGDALMQRISDVVEEILINGERTFSYTICRTIGNTANVGVLVGYSNFSVWNNYARRRSSGTVTGDTGDKPPGFDLTDVTDDFVIPNLDMIFDTITGNEQQSSASQNRYRDYGTKAVYYNTTTGSNPGATGHSIHLDYPILDPATGDVIITSTGGVDITGGAIIDGPGGRIKVKGYTGEALAIRFNSTQYRAYAIRKTATPFTVSGVGPTGAAANRQAVLMHPDHYTTLIGLTGATGSVG